MVFTTSVVLPPVGTCVRVTTTAGLCLQGRLTEGGPDSQRVTIETTRFGRVMTLDRESIKSIVDSSGKGPSTPPRAAVQLTPPRSVSSAIESIDEDAVSVASDCSDESASSGVSGSSGSTARTISDDALSRLVPFMLKRAQTAPQLLPSKTDAARGPAGYLFGAGLAAEAAPSLSVTASSFVPSSTSFVTRSSSPPTPPGPRVMRVPMGVPVSPPQTQQPYMHPHAQRRVQSYNPLTGTQRSRHTSPPGLPRRSHSFGPSDNMRMYAAPPAARTADYQYARHMASHTPALPVAVPAPAPSRAAAPKKKAEKPYKINEPCKYFNTPKGCTRGKSCRYRHIQLERSMPAEPQQQWSNSPVPIATRA